MIAVDPRHVVRYELECAGLAAFCAGLDLSEHLWPAAEAADRGDFTVAEAATARAFRAAIAASQVAEDAAMASSVAIRAASRVAHDAAMATSRHIIARVAGVAAMAIARAAVTASRAAAGASSVSIRAAAAQATWARARTLLVPGATDALELRRRVAEQIEVRPELHDQKRWGTGDPSCGTPQCAAGWICSLGGGTRGLSVELAARALSYVDDAPQVRFDTKASREEVISSLLGEQS